MSGGWAEQDAVTLLKTQPWHDRRLIPIIAAALREAEQRGIERAAKTLAALEKAANAARAYREEEASDTPRMWRGKQLQDLANELDDALAALDGDKDGQP